MAGVNSKPGGYDIEFVKEVNARLKCPICELALRIPFQTECGHRYCESCIKHVINSGNAKCPEDNTTLTLDQIFRDAFCNREILELECFCSNKNLGCTWMSFLRELEGHYKECLYVEIECPNEGCDVKLLKRLLEEHLNNSCKFKKVPCKYCAERISEPLIKEHCASTCTKYPLVCPKGCGERVPRAEMEKHVTHDCPNAESSCPMIGQCEFQGSRADLRKHLVAKNVEHASMVKDNISAIRTDIERIEIATTAVQVQQQTMEGQVTNHREEIASVRDDLAALRAGVDRYLNRTNEVEESARPLPAREPRGAGKPDANELDDLETRLAKLEDQMKQILVRERQALGRGQVGTQTSATTQGGANETVADIDRRVTAMEHQNTLSDVQMADHDVKITMLETTSYDGTFVWKIDDFGRRQQDSVTGRCLSIYSPQFYVGRYGYKVCARVYLNGDGMGKGTHLSLFFVVMRGGYDALLPWPFQQKVTFRLIDQGGDQDIVDSFRPDPNSSSFQRPTSNMNIASGCPLFVPKTVLHSRGYIKDETVFFKITVDTSGLTIL